MLAEPLPARVSATSAAERTLRTAIVSGELAPGERLPSERELAERFGISRLTLRAALATLAAAGLISVRHGSGYTVRDVRESGGADLLPELVEHATSTRDLVAAATDLLRMRRHLAGAVLEAIAERPPSAAARKAVARAVDEFARVVDSGASATADAMVDADLGVVRALLDATGSMILRVCLNPITAVLRAHVPLRQTIYAEPATNLAGWRALVAWVADPDPSAIPLLVGVLAERDRASLERLRRGRIK